MPLRSYFTGTLSSDLVLAQFSFLATTILAAKMQKLQALFLRIKLNVSEEHSKTSAILCMEIFDGIHMTTYATNNCIMITIANSLWNPIEIETKKETVTRIVLITKIT